MYCQSATAFLKIHLLASFHHFFSLHKPNQQFKTALQIRTIKRAADKGKLIGYLQFQESILCHVDVLTIIMAVLL